MARFLHEKSTSVWDKFHCSTSAWYRVATLQIADVNNNLQPEGECQREQEKQRSVDRGRGQDIKWSYKQADMIKQQWQQVRDNVSLHRQSCSLHIHTCLSPGYQFMVAVHLQSSPNLSHTLTQTTPETKRHLPPCHTHKHRASGGSTEHFNAQLPSEWDSHYKTVLSHQHRVEKVEFASVCAASLSRQISRKISSWRKYK